MIETNRQTVDAIIDRTCRAVDGKVSSSKPFSQIPFDDFADYIDWGKDNNDSQNDTNRTRALFLSYVLLNGSRIPMQGTRTLDGWVRPDKWVAGALVKKGYLRVDLAANELVVTVSGWTFLADTVERL